jgi:hypothetical protein
MARRRRVLAALATVMVSATGVVEPVSAAADDSNSAVVDCNDNAQALQPAIASAAPGTTVRVKGTCRGNFTIDKDLTLIGVRRAVLDGLRAGTTLAVAAPARVRLTNMTITDGNGTFAGGILNGGTLELHRSAVSHNSSTFGGGINNLGTLTATYSTLSYNTANSGGGLSNATGTATLKRSTVKHNTATAHGGGGIETSGSGGTARLTLTDSTVSDNNASTVGGGIYNNPADGTATVSLNRSTVTRNTSTLGGGIYNDGGAGTGTLSLTHSALTRNSASGGPGSGGGIYNDGGAVTLTHSTVRNNDPDNCAPPGSVPSCSV